MRTLIVFKSVLYWTRNQIKIIWVFAAVFRQEFVLVFSGKVAKNQIRINEIKKKVRKSTIFRQGRYVHKIALTSRT